MGRLSYLYFEIVFSERQSTLVNIFFLIFSKDVLIISSIFKEKRNGFMRIYEFLSIDVRNPFFFS